MCRLRRVVIALTIPLAAGAAPAAGPKIAGHDVGRPGGLAVVAGRDADRHAAELAETGRWLVRVIARDEAHAARCRASTEALLPLVTVRAGRERLPFAPQTVNLLVLGAGAGIPQAECARVGYSVSKRLGGAVERNTVKRALREAFRECKPDLSGPVDLVFVARAPLVDLVDTEGAVAVKQRMLEVLKKASLIEPGEERLSKQ